MAETTPSEVPVRDGESGWEDPTIPPEQPQSEAFTSSQSEFAVDTSVHVEQGRKGTRGGKPARLNPAIGVPEPKFRKYKSDATDPHQRTKSFYNYWNGLPDWAKESTLCYVYREHPVLVWIERDKEDRSPGQEFNYIDKISGTEPVQDDADLLNRYGCGNYKLTFNAIIAGQANRTLCNAYAVNLGGGDYRSNPPTDQRITDSKNVDLDHPSNKAYVAYLRGVGLLPSQIDAIRGEQDMATVEVLKEQQTTTSKLVDTVVKMAQDKSERKTEDSGMMERAFAVALETVQAGTKATIEMVREEAKRSTATAIQAPVPPAADPFDLALRLVTLIQSGKEGSGKEVELLRAEINALQASQMRMMQDQLKTLTESLTNKTSPNASNPFAQMQEGMKAMRDMKSVVDEISGAGEKESVVEAAAESAGVPKWVTQIAMPLVGQIAQAAQGFFNMRAAQNMPPGQYPPQAPGYPPNPQGFPQPGWNGPGGQYQPQPQSQPQPATPGMTPQATGPQLVQARHPLAILDPATFTPELAQLLSAISIPLGAHLAEDINGTAFADWFMSGFGEGTHGQIVEFGLDNVIAALYSFPPTLVAVQGFPAEKVKEFVAEFLNPQFEEGEGEGEGGGEEGSTATTPEPEKTPA